MSGRLCGISSILNGSNSEMSYGSATTYLRLKQALARRLQSVLSCLPIWQFV